MKQPIPKYRHTSYYQSNWAKQLGANINIDTLVGDG